MKDAAMDLRMRAVAALVRVSPALFVVLIALQRGPLAWAASSPRPALLVLSKAEATLAVVDPATLQVVARVPTGEGPHEVAVSADRKLAFVSNYGGSQPGSTLSVIEIATAKELRRVDLGALRRPHGIVVVDGSVYFTAEVNRAIARYDPVANRVDRTVETGQVGTHMLVVTPDRKRLYTANIGSNTVSAIDLTTAQDPPTVTQIAVGKAPEGIAISPDGREVWVGHNEDGGVSIIDTATNRVKETIQVGGMPIRLQFTPDGKRVLVSNPRGGELVVLDAATRKAIKRLPVGQTPVGIVVTPDGKRAFVATTAANRVAVIDLETLALTGTIAAGANPDGMAWVASG
jgi:YVTN family beta-propeller protein